MHLAELQVDGGASAPHLVGDWGDLALEIDRLQRRQGLARILLHLELRPRDEGLHVALLEVRPELPQRLLAAFLVLAGRAKQGSELARLVQVADDPDGDPDTDRRKNACDDDGNDGPPNEDEGDDPRYRHDRADPEKELLPVDGGLLGSLGGSCEVAQLSLSG